MSFHANPLVIRSRSLARKPGMLSLATKRRNAGEIVASLASADSLVAGGEPAPNFIKIDVGYEHEVLEGMAKMLRAAQLRALCIKAHTTQLADRRLAHSPGAIEGQLRKSGFGMDWVDAAHNVATRAV